MYNPDQIEHHAFTIRRQMRETGLHLIELPGKAFVGEFLMEVIHYATKCAQKMRFHDAEDLASELVIKILDEKLEFYDESKPFKPWLKTVCHNFFINIDQAHIPRVIN